jgi:DNA-directed RNA polymerase subunit RPC12/RpoP
MPRLQSRHQREVAFLELAKRMYSELEAWYDNHPQASFGEIESEARRRRRDLMGELLALLINGRDVGYQLQPPVCTTCGQAMEFEKYRAWQVKGLEGDTEFQRAYYVCPHCDGQTLFPPRPKTPLARGSLE